MQILSRSSHDVFLKNIRARRIELGWTQQKLAEILGVSRVQVTQTESGSFVPTLDYVDRVAEALQTTTSDLLAEKNFATHG